MQQLSVARKMADLPPPERDKIIGAMTEEEAEGLLYNWRDFLARPEQVPPDGDWEIWMILSGRGWGKTRTGAEWIKENIENGNMRRVALVGETSADCRDVMVEGDSGILSLYPPSQQPNYEPSKRRITWPSLGAVATLYNAVKPDQLRGPQHDGAWSDEVAKWKYARETWDQLQFGLRLGDNPRQIVTSTPRPIELVRAIASGEEGAVHITKGDTRDNADNLSSKFLKKVLRKYEGTRLGRQELNGEILGDFPNGLWSQQQIDLTRVSSMPKDLARVVVAVDPGVTEDDMEEAATNGIVVTGVNKSGEIGYVLEDGSIQGSPKQWARRAIALYDHYHADAIIVEINNGGAMCRETLLSVRSSVPVREVRATRGKHVRAEPISSLYEQGRIMHVGSFPELEDQMGMMTTSGFKGLGSPDRVDALVWGLTDLFEDLVNIDDEPMPEWRARRVV